MKPPSTAWVEQIAPDEAERHARQAETVAAIQARVSAKEGAGRGFHRRAILALRGELEVLPDLPAHARHGLFAQPGAHPTWIRLSGGAVRPQKDRAPDIRGFALKIDVPEAPGALGGPTRHQDFALINRAAFGFRTSAEFMGVVGALQGGPIALIGHHLRTWGFFEGIRRFVRLARSTAAPFHGFACDPFYSAAPVAVGPYAARVRLAPGPATPDPAARDDLAADVKRRLAAGPLSWELQLQFFVDEATTPIEDAENAWPDAEAPWLTVARLTVPPQPFDGQAYADFAAKVEATVFDPWEALAEHRPVGEVMRSRKAAYFASEKARGALG